MKTNTSCPMCRKNLVSRTQWYQENDVNNEIDELTTLSENINMNMVQELRKLNFNKEENIELIYQNNHIKKRNDEEMKRKIRLNTDINYSRGYLEGLSNKKVSKELRRALKQKGYRNSPYVIGYHAGYHERREIYPDEKKTEEAKEEEKRNEEMKIKLSEEKTKLLQTVIEEFNESANKLKETFIEKINNRYKNDNNDSDEECASVMLF